MAFRSRNEINLGDLAIAIKRLPTQESDVLAKIAACLGFGIEPPKPQRKGVWDQTQSPERQEPSPLEPQKAAVSPTRDKAKARVSLPKPPFPVEGYVSRIRLLERQGPVLPELIKRAQPISLDTKPTARTSREPIFAQRTERAVLSAAIGVQSATGHVDLEKIIDRLVRLKLIDELPRRPLPTLKYGVQLMLDRSESMRPFYEDLKRLEQRLKQISGGSSFSSDWFKGSPITPRRSQKSQEPLKIANSVPLLIATDFGIGAPLLSREQAGPGDWSGFARQARRKGCPLVALIPHKPKYWPDWALADFLCIHWNRSTTAGDLRKVIGVGHNPGG